MDQAYRVTLEYCASSCTVKSVSRLNMRISGGEFFSEKTHKDEKKQRKVGQFVEVYGHKKTLLYRRFINNIVPKSIGTPSADADKPYARAPLGKMHGITSILVPCIECAQQIVIVEAKACKQTKKSKKASAQIEMQELMNVSLDDVREIN